MFKRTKVSAGVLAALGGVLALVQPVYAQTTERVEVTGSRIRTFETETSSPIVSIGAEAIKISGVANVEELLNNLPQVFAGFGAQVSNGSTGTATVDLRGLGPERTLVLVNGRRLPAGDPNNVGSPFNAVPDVNQIPISLIKRVEVLTGGASAVYGSDAVAGVINFILNDRFQGVQVEVNHSLYNHKQHNPGNIDALLAARHFDQPGNVTADGQTTDISVTMGSNFADNKGNATVFFGYKNTAALTQAKRDFSACTLGLNGTATAFSCSGSSTTAGPGNAPGGRFFNTTTGDSYSIDSTGATVPYSGSAMSYNFGPLNYFQRPDQRYTAAAYLKYDINDMAKVYSEFNFMDDHSVAQIAPSGLFFGSGPNADGSYTLRDENPLIPASMKAALGIPAGGSATAYIGRRNVEGGPRQDDLRHTMFRSVTGVKGDIGPWSYDVSAQVGKVLYQEEYHNDVSIVKSARAMDVVTDPNTGNPVCRSVLDGSDPNCVPYNIWVPGGVTAAAVNYLNTPGFKTGYTSQLVYGANGSVDLGAYGIKVPSASAGASLAFGIESRQEKLSLRTDQEFTSGDLAGQGGPTIGQEGAYSVRDIYAEFKMPLLEKMPGAERLTLDAAYRHSSYSTDKKTNTYGLGLDWEVAKGYQLRGSFQRAVRAANIVDLYSAQSLALFNLSADPCGPSQTATLAQCQLTGLSASQYGATVLDNPAGQYNQLTGGNPTLKPETSNSYTLGVVLQPIKDLSLTFDYFNFKVDDAISTVAPGLALAQCLNTGNPTYCALVHRAGNGSLWTGGGYVSAQNANVAQISTAGLDVGADYSLKMEGAGRLDFSLLGTWLRKFVTEPAPGLGSYDCAGYFGNTCGVPAAKWRHTARVTWMSPYNLNLSATWRYFGSVKDEGTSTNTLLSAAPISLNGAGFKAVNYIDLSAAYNVTKNLTARVGVHNLFDKDPPLTTAGAPFGNGNTYPVVYDALGRQFNFSLTASF